MAWEPTEPPAAPALAITIDDLELNGNGDTLPLGTLELPAAFVGQSVVLTTWLVFESAVAITDQELTITPAGDPFPNTGAPIGWTGLGTDSVTFYGSHVVTFPSSALELELAATSNDGLAKVTAQVALSIALAVGADLTPPGELFDVEYHVQLEDFLSSPVHLDTAGWVNGAGLLFWVTDPDPEPIDPTTITEWVAPGAPPEGATAFYLKGVVHPTDSLTPAGTAYAFIVLGAPPIDGPAWGYETSDPTSAVGWWADSAHLHIREDA